MGNLDQENAKKYNSMPRTSYKYIGKGLGLRAFFLLHYLLILILKPLFINLSTD